MGKPGNIAAKTKFVFEPSQNVFQQIQNISKPSKNVFQQIQKHFGRANYVSIRFLLSSHISNTRNIVFSSKRKRYFKICGSVDLVSPLPQSLPPPLLTTIAGIDINNVSLKFVGSLAPPSLTKKSSAMRDPRTGKGIF